MSNQDDVEISLLDFLIQMSRNDSTDLLLEKWEDQSRLKAMISRRNSIQLDDLNTHLTPSNLYLPLQCRPVLPPAEIFGEDWAQEIRSTVDTITGVKMFAEPDKWAVFYTALINKCDVSLLAACTFEGQESLLSLNFINLFVFMVFLVGDKLEDFVRSENSEGLADAAAAFHKALSEGSVKNLKNDDNEIDKTANVIRVVNRNLEKFLGKKRERKKFFKKYKAEIAEFMSVFKYRNSIRDSPQSLSNYLRQRIKESPWFSITMWYKIQNYDEFGEGQTGFGSATDSLEQLARLHIALSQDIIRFSRSKTRRSRWNIVSLLMRHGFSQEEAVKIGVEMLNDVLEDFNRQVEILYKNEEPSFRKHFDRAFKYFMLYCLNCISASYVWGSRAEIFVEK